MILVVLLRSSLTVVLKGLQGFQHPGGLQEVLVRTEGPNTIHRRFSETSTVVLDQLRVSKGLERLEELKDPLKGAPESQFFRCLQEEDSVSRFLRVSGFWKKLQEVFASKLFFTEQDVLVLLIVQHLNQRGVGHLQRLQL